MALRFGWGFFRDLIDWTPATVSAYGNPQVKADFLKLAADAPTTVTATATAHSGGGQGSALLITSDYTNVTTVAAAGDSIKLPPASVGLSYTVTNNGANSLSLFPNTGDTINGGSANAPIYVLPKSTIALVAINSTDWQSNPVRSLLPTTTKGVEVAKNATANISAAELIGGFITSTSASATVLTLPTASQLAAQLNAQKGTYFDFLVDNSDGANNVTIQVNTGIQAITPAITGGGNLVVSTSNLIGYFRITFISSSNAIIARII